MYTRHISDRSTQKTKLAQYLMKYFYNKFQGSLCSNRVHGNGEGSLMKPTSEYTYPAEILCMND